MPERTLLTNEILENLLNFHDCEILGFSAGRENVSIEFEIELKRKSLDNLSSMTKSTKGKVKLFFTGVESMRIEDFNHQNVIQNLSIVRLGENEEVLIKSSFGLEGTILAHRIEIQFI